MAENPASRGLLLQPGFVQRMDYPQSIMLSFHCTPQKVNIKKLNCSTCRQTLAKSTELC